MRWTKLTRVALATAALALPAAQAPAALAHDGRPCGPRHDGGGRHRDERYARAVIADHPSYYWRLGESGGSPDAMGDASADATYGTQVTALVPGALAGGDVAVGLSGATPDNVWESHVAAGDGAHTIAPGTAHFGIEIWARPDTLDGNSRRIASRELPAGGYLLAARADALVFSRFVHTAGGDQWSTLSAPPLPLHAWSYLVADYDADGVMRLYVNGQLAGQLASSLQLPDDPGDGTAAGGRFLLGASSRLWNPLDPAAHAYLEWDGALDEAAFYGPTATNLTPRQIRHHWRIGSGEHGHW
jgi:Concanavalin A-like lectin/glucanases superfamily